MAVQRWDRLHKKDTEEIPADAGVRDVRAQYARDRDRVIYTSSFRRLAGVTQVVSAAEGHIFHTRLTHTIETAQIARRLAEQLRRRQPELTESLGLDPEVADAAALAHDLGHPPFGHVGEETIDEVLTKELNVPEGFEGNAQSFRIVTKLAIHKEEYRGLDLTRATLNAILKYPRQPYFKEGKKSEKFGAYSAETSEFQFAREMHAPGDDNKSLEAEVMDWADDIAYAVHDVEDFYRAGLIPLDRILRGDSGELQRFVDSVFERWKREDYESDYDNDDLEHSFKKLVKLLRVEPHSEEPYDGTQAQRAALRSLTSFLIERYANAISAKESAGPDLSRVKIEEAARLEVAMLKQLTWQYVIRNPSLATQQYGQREIIRKLMRAFMEAAESKDRALLPLHARETLDQLLSGARADQKHIIAARVVTDVVAGLTEKQALDIFGRLTGYTPGSVLDAIVP